MPIAKANMGNGFSGVVGYVMVQKDVAQELQPKVIECNNVLQSSSDNIARQMRNLAQDNGTKKPVMHMQISFHPDEKLSSEQAQKAIDSIIKDAGIDRNNHQFLVVEHFDKNHQHFHVVCNRVGLDNKLLSDSHLKIKLNVACDKVEKEQGLRPTEGRQYQFDVNTGEGKFVKVEKTKEQAKKLPNDKREKVKAAKEQVQNKVIDVLKIAKTPQEFKEKLAEKGVEVRFSEDRANNNAIRGASFRTDDVAVKGGDIGFKWNEISTILETNLSQEQSQKINAPGQMAAAPAEVKGESVKTTEKPVLSEEIKHKILLFIEKNPQKISNNEQLTDQAIRIYMKEVKPHENSLNTWEAHQDHKEQREILNKCATIVLSEAKATEATAQYNEGFKGVVNEFNAEVAKGNVDFDLDQMIRRNLQIVQNNHPVLQEYLEEHVPKVETAQQDLIKQLSEYKRQLENYELLMSAEREKITLKTTMLLENPEIERRNQELEKRKAEAIKPEFKPQVTLSVADFTKTPKYVDPQRAEVIKLVVKAKISTVLSKQETQTPEKLRQGLKEKGIEVKYSENSSGISNISFQIKDTTFRGFEVGFKDAVINNALQANKPLKSVEIDNSQAYRTAVTDTINQFKKEAEAGNVNFDVKAMFEENIKKHIPEPDAATIQKINVALPEFRDAQQKVINQYITHKKDRPNEVFKPTVQLYERNFIKSSTFKDETQELLKGISETTKQVQARNQESEEQKKSQGRGFKM